MLQQISSNKKIYACPHVGAPFLWGPLCGRTGRTCLNPPLPADGDRHKGEAIDVEKGRYGTRWLRDDDDDDDDYGAQFSSQDAQLLQRDRTAGCVIIVLAKSGRLELGDNILRTL